jgi:hypothetical protein
MSTVATATSFDQLVQKIELASSPSSRSNSCSDYSPYHGSNDSSPRKSQLYSPRDSGVFMESSDSLTDDQKNYSNTGDTSRTGHGFGSQEVAQYHLFHPPRRIDTNNASSPSLYTVNREAQASPTQRSRTPSSASSVGSLNFPLRHNLERNASKRSSTTARPVTLSRILHDANTSPSQQPSPTQGGVNRSTASLRPGCILSSAGEMANIRAVTHSGLPVWWCRFDNMVIFDGMLKNGDTGVSVPMTRSSKGLPIANAKGMVETVRFQLDCDHCKHILRFATWKYAARVCQRSVCAACRVKCVQEQERIVEEASKANSPPAYEGIIKNDDDTIDSSNFSPPRQSPSAITTDESSSVKPRDMNILSPGRSKSPCVADTTDPPRGKMDET